MKKLVNFLNVSHKLTEEQVTQAAKMGWEILEDEEINKYRKILSNLEGKEDLKQMSFDILWYCHTHDIKGLLGPIGSPLFSHVFAIEWSKYHSIIGKPTMLFSHTLRESVEKQLPDGSIQKTFVFKHVGFHVLDEHSYMPIGLNLSYYEKENEGKRSLYDIFPTPAKRIY